MRGTSPSKSSISIFIVPRIDFVFWRKNPVRTDVVLELLDGHGEVVLGLAVLLEQRLRDAVDVHVGRLRGEHHGDEQLEVGAEAQRDRRVRVRGREPLDDRQDPLALRPDAPPRL